MPDSSVDTNNRSARSRRGFRFFLTYSIYLLLLVFVGLKLFWYVGYGVSPTQTMTEEDVWLTFYQTVRHTGVRDGDRSTNDGFFDVVALGGSVMDQASPVLEQKLRKRFGDKLRYYNLAKEGHTSRDSLLKFQIVAEDHFDLVVVYNGINDAAMNNIREEWYKDDYTHCGWYAAIKKRIAAKKVTVLNLAGDRIDIIATAKHTPEEQEFGRLVKTDVSVGQNLGQLAEAASRSGSQVMLMSFAHYIADGYEQTAFHADAFDYGKGYDHMEVEFWGSPQHIPSILKAQNVAIRDVHAKCSNTILVEQESLMPASGEYFSDVCHMTAIGRELFCENILSHIPAMPEFE